LDGLSIDLASAEDPSLVAASGYTISRQQARVHLTSDVVQIYEFLGVPAHLANGITRVTLDEMLRAIMGSPFFDPAHHGVGADPAVSKSKRQQVLKRPAWAELSAAVQGASVHVVFAASHPFKEYCGDGSSRSPDPPQNFAAVASLHKLAAEHFGCLTELNDRCSSIKALHDHALQHKQARVKFSGRTLESWFPGLKRDGGRCVGELLAALRAHAQLSMDMVAEVSAEDAFDLWVLSSSLDDIRVAASSKRFSSFEAALAASLSAATTVQSRRAHTLPPNYVKDSAVPLNGARRMHSMPARLHVRIP